jgi:hypothetical protein
MIVLNLLLNKLFLQIPNKVVPSFIIQVFQWWNFKYVKILDHEHQTFVVLFQGSKMGLCSLTIACLVARNSACGVIDLCAKSLTANYFFELIFSERELILDFASSALKINQFLGLLVELVTKLVIFLLQNLVGLLNFLGPCQR